MNITPSFIKHRILAALLLLAPFLVSCDEEALNHTCDESKELRFPEFGADAVGFWKSIDVNNVACHGPCIDRFEITSDGAFKSSATGCNLNDFPLVLNDHNVFRSLLGIGKVELVKAQTREGFIRLDYESQSIAIGQTKESFNEGFVEIQRVGPDRIDLKERLPMGAWWGVKFRRYIPGTPEDPDIEDTQEDSCEDDSCASLSSESESDDG